MKLSLNLYHSIGSGHLTSSCPSAAARGLGPLRVRDDDQLRRAILTLGSISIPPQKGPLAYSGKDGVARRAPTRPL